MMLPIEGREPGRRPTPWVSFSLMAICAVVFLLTDTASIHAPHDGPWYAKNAADYWRNHAYLSADHEIRARVAYDVLPEQRTHYLELLVENARPTTPDDPVRLGAEQARLDRLSALGLGHAEPSAAELGDGPLSRWGFVAHAPNASALVTHAFVHVGWLDVVSNILLLLLLAPAVERRLGHAIFASFYLSIAAAAALFHAALTQSPLSPLVGALGATAGVLGAFLVLYHSTPMRVTLPFARPGGGDGPGFEVSAWMAALVFAACAATQAIWLASLDLGMTAAWQGQLGGVALGCAALLTLRGLGFASSDVDVENVESVESDTEVQAAARANDTRGEDTDADESTRSEGLVVAEAPLEITRVSDPSLTDIARSAPLFGDAPMLEEDDEGFDSWPTPLVLDDDTAVLDDSTESMLGDSTDSLLGDSTDSLLDDANSDTQVVAATDQPPPRATTAIIAEAKPPDPKSGDTNVLRDPDQEAREALHRVPRFADLKCVAAVPVALVDDGLRMFVDGAQKAKLDFERIHAIALGAVNGLREKTVIVVDLLLDWRDHEATTLRSIRLLSPDYDPRSLVAGHEQATSALHAFVAELADRSDAVVLPGRPDSEAPGFSTFASLAEYEREVLQSDS